MRYAITQLRTVLIYKFASGKVATNMKVAKVNKCFFAAQKLKPISFLICILGQFEGTHIFYMRKSVWLMIGNF